MLLPFCLLLLFGKRFLTHLLFLCLLLLVTSRALPAEPKGADLLRACEHALAHQFAGVEGRMCTWYVTPCDCDLGKAPDLPRVCLPDPPPTEALAREVVAALRAEPRLKTEGAAAAAALILAPRYPCRD